MTTSYDRDKQILHITVEGPFAMEDVKAVLDGMQSSPEYPPDVDAVWDLRRGDFLSVNADVWRRIIEFRRRYTRRAGCRSALVVTGDLAYGMARMYVTLAEGVIPQEITVCRSVEEAEKWILEARSTSPRARPSSASPS